MRFFDFKYRITSTLALQFYQLTRVGSAVLSGILLAKSGLHTSLIGAWEMLLFLGTTFTFFWVNGLLQGMSQRYAVLDEGDRRVFIFNTFLVFSGLSLLLYLFLSLGETWLTPVLTGMEGLPYFQVFCLYMLLNLPSYPVEYIYLLREKPWAIVFWGIIGSLGHLAGLFLPIWMGFGLESGVWGLVAFSALKFVWTAVLVFRMGTARFDGAMIGRYLLFCMPLMFSNIIGNLILLFDNWLVGWHFKDAEIFAVYRYGAREFPLATALVTALGVSLAPILATDLSKGLAMSKDKSRRLMHLLFPLTMALMLSSSWFFPLVFNADFKESAALFNIYLLTLASRILLPASIVLAKGDSRSIFWVHVLELFLKIGTGFLFIEWWGLPGLAWSVVCSYWVEKIGLIWMLERKYQVRTAAWLDLRWYAVYVGLLLLVYGLNATFF